MDKKTEMEGTQTIYSHTCVILVALTDQLHHRASTVKHACWSVLCARQSEPWCTKAVPLLTAQHRSVSILDKSAVMSGGFPVAVQDWLNMLDT